MANSRLVSIPHSWPLYEWPPHVYPCKSSKAKYITRAHRNELVAAGALVRVGRDLVVMGAPYSAWLAKQANRVNGFELAMNRTPTETARLADLNAA
jgi:hypothetical protein